MLSTEMFLEIEKKYDLYNEQIEGCNFWIYSRFAIWENYIRGPKQGIEIINRTPKIKNKLKTFFQLGKTYFFQGNIPTKKVDVCFLSHERRYFEDGIYKCMYTELLSDYFSNNIILEKPYLYNHFKPIACKNVIYTDRASINGELERLFNKNILKKRYKEILNKIYEKICDPICELSKAYNVTIDIDSVVTLIAKKIFSYKGKYNYFKSVLDKTQPKIIVEVVSYAMDCMMINELAAERGITTIELQHGQIAEWHIAYRYNKDVMVKQLPTKVFMFSDFAKKYIDLPIPDSNLVSVGYPYFEKMKKKYEKKSKSNKIGILFISQKEIGKELSKIAMEIYKSLPKDKYYIIYKLHPSEFENWKSNYPCLSETNIKVIDNKNCNLYECFAESDIQVGVCSTGLYEGLGFGLRTYIYKHPLSEGVRLLCQEGYAQYFDDYKELLCLMEGTNDKKLVEGIWKENALQNIIEEIQREINING